MPGARQHQPGRSAAEVRPGWSALRALESRAQCSQFRIAFFTPRQPGYGVTFGQRSLRDNATDIPGRPSYKYPHLLSFVFVLDGQSRVTALL